MTIVTRKTAVTALLRWSAVFVVFLAGLWFRARYADGRGLWLDEYGTLWAARGETWLDTVRRVVAVHGQSPFYYLLVRGVLALTGESEPRIRFVSIAAGSLVPLVGFFAGRRALGERAGALAALLLALDASLIWEAENARPYALAELFALVALWGLARALETGAPRDRALAWSGAVLSVYAHYVFAPVIPALFLGALAGGKRAYPSRKLLADAAIAVVALAPALRHVFALIERRQELAWVDKFSLAPIGAMLPPRSRWFVLPAALYALATRPLRGRGALAFVAASAALTGGAILGLYLIGSNILDERYLALGLVTMPVLSGWSLASLPRPLMAISIAIIAVLSMRDYEPHRNWGQEWRGATRELLVRRPQPDEPILLWTGFIEADLVPRRARVTPELRGFLSSPIIDQPYLPEIERPIFLLTCKWNVPGQSAYFDSELLPLLDRAERFFVIAHPGYEEELAKWIAAREPGRFKRTQVSREFVAPVIVVTYSRS